ERRICSKSGTARGGSSASDSRCKDVAEGVLLNARSQIWKLRTSCRRVVQNEAILFQNPTGGTVFRMAKGRQANHPGAPGHLDHRRQRLGSIAFAPGVFCQDVPGHGLL